MRWYFLFSCPDDGEPRDANRRDGTVRLLTVRANHLDNWTSGSTRLEPSASAGWMDYRPWRHAARRCAVAVWVSRLR
uniref:Uncharacterized protein n=1 Tax=Oryza sativa subsp. japonica TaxID=39947 RepID=Q69QF9_ORYSJ|nr:hypothetical protein [Oryza sativa Japonica Group]